MAQEQEWVSYFCIWLARVIIDRPRLDAYTLHLESKPRSEDVRRARSFASAATRQRVMVVYEKDPPRLVLTWRELDPNPPPFLEQFPIPLLPIPPR